MKFTVKEKKASSVTIEYEDKSIAIIPITKNFTKQDIQDRAAFFNEKVTEFDSVDDVPVDIGEELEATPYASNPTSQLEAGYKEARRFHYPEVEKQLDAAYWARNGDDTQQKAIDATIKLVKDSIPKTWKGKRGDISKLLD